MIILSITFLIFKYQLYNIYLTFYIKFLKEKTIVLALDIQNYYSSFCIQFLLTFITIDNY